jgi:hypothetical protein
MKFNDIIKYLLDEELDLTTEGRQSEISRMGLSNSLKLNPEFSDTSKFKETFSKDIANYFKNVNASIFAKYGPTGNQEKDYPMDEILANIYSKILEEAESINYIVNTRDFTKTSGQTTQEKNYIVRESPIGKATFQVADEMGVKYQKNVNKQRGVVNMIKNAFFALNQEGENYLFQNIDKQSEEIAKDTPNVAAEYFEVTKSIRDPRVKAEISSKLGEDVYSVLKTGTFSFVAVGSKATSNELIAEIRDAFRDEGVKVKPIMALDVLQKAGVVSPTDTLEDDEQPEKSEDEEEKEDPSKIHEIDPDFFAKDSTPDYKSLGIDTADISRDRDFDSSNW